MMTIPAWKALRRVDHLDLGLFHPRFRARNANTRPDLKVFDPMLMRLIAAQNDYDRVVQLGDIIAAASNLIAGMAVHPQRYQNPVTALLADAVNDMNQICGVAGAAQRDQDIVNMSNNIPLVQKTVSINTYFIAAVGANAPGGIDQLIDDHIDEANHLPGYISAGLRVARTNAHVNLITQHNNQSILPTNGPDTGKFQEGKRSIFDLIQYMNARGGNGASVDVMYVDELSADDVQGFTARTGPTAVYSGVKPAHRPIVFVRRTPSPIAVINTYDTTLAHELGHALSDSGAHSLDPLDLMSSGAIRQMANNLSLGAKAWYRHSPCAV